MNTAEVTLYGVVAILLSYITGFHIGHKVGLEYAEYLAVLEKLKQK